MPKKGESPRFEIKKDKDVERWYKNRARGSMATADNYTRVLSRFCEHHGTTPKGFIAMKNKDRTDLVSDYIDELISQKKAPSYVGVYYKVLKSWLEFNGKELGRKITIPNANRRPTLENVTIPSQDQLRRVLNIANARERTAIAFIAFSGLRPEVLGSYKGDDGLRFCDLPEIKVKDGQMEIKETPIMVKVPERLSKVGHSYFTFLGPEGCEYLSAYVQERKALWEHITLDSPVIVPKGYRAKQFIQTINIGDLIRKPMRRAGVSGPPYIFRSYFASRAMLAESNGLLRDYRVFFMGHKGDIEHVYSLHKQVPPDTVEAMRKGYEAALQYLETIPKASKDDSVKELITFLLTDRGLSEEDIEKMGLEEKTSAELLEILKQTPKAALKQNGNHMQKVISIQDLPRALDEGWEFKATLPDGRAIVENGHLNADNGGIPFREK